METLPDEVVALILGYAAPLTLWRGKLKLVCSQWRHILETTPVLVRRAHGARLLAYNKGWISPRKITHPGGRELKELGVHESKRVIQNMVVISGDNHVIVSAHNNFTFFAPQSMVVRKWSLETKKYQGKPVIVLGHTLLGATKNVILSTSGNVFILTATDGTPIKTWRRNDPHASGVISGGKIFFLYNDCLSAWSLETLTKIACVECAHSENLVSNDDREGGVRFVGCTYTYSWNPTEKDPGASVRRVRRHFSDKYYYHKATDHWIRGGELYW